jgi:hypothetical protein
VLGPVAGFAVALLANLVLDGALALGLVLVTTANTLTTAPHLRGRVNAAGSTLAALVRGARPRRRGGRRGGAGRARQSTHGLRGAGGLLPAHGAGNGVGGVATVGSVKVSATGRSDRVPLGGIGRASVESRAPVRQTGWGTCRLSQPGRRIHPRLTDLSGGRDYTRNFHSACPPNIPGSPAPRSSAP